MKYSLIWIFQVAKFFGVSFAAVSFLVIFNGSEAVEILAKLIHRSGVPDIPVGFCNVTT